MTLHQMRNLLAIAQYGSLSAAAHALYVSQSSLSSMLQEVERELGITIFDRTSRGVIVTAQGKELLALARQVVQQDDILRSRFGAHNDNESAPRFVASAQHYSLGVNAFCALIKHYEKQNFSFLYKETTTEQVIADVRTFNSQVGLLYLSSSNEQILSRELKAAELEFTPLFSAKPVILVAKEHPISTKKQVNAADLAPFPRISFGQGNLGGAFFAEEPLSELPHTGEASVCDRNAMIRLLESTAGYTVATGSPHDGLKDSIVELSIKTEERMRIGYITHATRALSSEGRQFIGFLEQLAQERNQK